MADELWRWTAGELVRGIRTRAISSREATESCLARLDEVNPRINAVVDPLADEALADRRPGGRCDPPGRGARACSTGCR